MSPSVHGLQAFLRGGLFSRFASLSLHLSIACLLLGLTACSEKTPVVTPPSTVVKVAEEPKKTIEKPPSRPDFDVLNLPDCPGESDAVVIFPDGQKAATCGDDGQVTIFDLTNPLTTLASFQGIPGAPLLAVSRDGGVLAQASFDDTRVIVWDLANQKELKTLSEHKLPITAVAFSPDSSKLASSATASDDTSSGEIRLWDLNADYRSELLQPEADVVAIAFSPDGKQLSSAGPASANSTGAVSATTIWNLETRKAATTISNAFGDTYALAFSPDGTALAIAEQNGPRRIQSAHRVRLVDRYTGAELTVLGAHWAPIHGLAFAPNGQFLLSVGDDARLRVWQLATRSVRSVLDSWYFRRNLISFSQDGERLSLVSTNGGSKARPTICNFAHVVRLGNATSKSVAASTQLLDAPTRLAVSAVMFSDDGSELAFIRSRATWVYDTQNWEGRVILQEELPGWASVARYESYRGVSDRGRQIVLNGKTMNVIAMSPDGKKLAYLEEADSVHIWDLPNNVEQGTIVGTLAVFSRDGSLVATKATANDVSSVILWNAQTLERIHTLEGGHFLGVSALAFSPDGKLVASGSRDGTVTVWRTSDGKQAWEP